MKKTEKNKKHHSPLLTMEYIRQTNRAKVLNSQKIIPTTVNTSCGSIHYCDWCSKRCSKLSSPPHTMYPADFTFCSKECRDKMSLYIGDD